MFENLKKILQKIQTADEARKKRWLFIATAVIMILVIGFWAVYLNKTISNSGRAATTAEPAYSQQSVQAPKESAWRVFLTGFKTIAGQIKELITSARKISVESNSPNSATSSQETSNTASQ